MTTPSRQLAAALNAFKQEFTKVAEALTSLAVRRAHVAPTFMRLFARYQQETGRTFIAFVKELDPSVPADRASYQRHRSFQAALYLRRLVDSPETTPQHRKTLSPYQLLVPATKSLLVLYPHASEVWEAVARSSRWDARQLDRFRRHVAAARPLVGKPGAPRLVKRGTIRSVAAVAADRGHRATA